MVTELYFSIIKVFWLLNLCGPGGDASFAPEANLVFYVFSFYMNLRDFVLFCILFWIFLLKFNNSIFR